MKDIFDEREKRYGNYSEQAMIAQTLITFLLANLARKRKKLDSDQLDALQMIAVKIARIINGDPDYPDSWRDIAGYATLVADRLEKTQ